MAHRFTNEAAHPGVPGTPGFGVLGGALRDFEGWEELT
jgi:hypothetical protein